MTLAYFTIQADNALYRLNILSGKNLIQIFIVHTVLNIIHC